MNNELGGIHDAGFRSGNLKGDGHTVTIDHGLKNIILGERTVTDLLD